MAKLAVQLLKRVRNWKLVESTMHLRKRGARRSPLLTGTRSTDQFGWKMVGTENVERRGSDLIVIRGGIRWRVLSIKCIMMFDLGSRSLFCESFLSIHVQTTTTFVKLVVPRSSIGVREAWEVCQQLALSQTRFISFNTIVRCVFVFALPCPGAPMAYDSARPSTVTYFLLINSAELEWAGRRLIKFVPRWSPVSYAINRGQLLIR